MKLEKHWVLIGCLVALLLAGAAAAASQVLAQLQATRRIAFQAAAAAEAAARQRLGPQAQLQRTPSEFRRLAQEIRIEAEQDPILYKDDGAYYGGDWWDWWWPLNPYQWGGGGYYSGPFYGKRWGGGQGKWNWQEWADGAGGPQVRPGPPIGSGIAPM